MGPLYVLRCHAMAQPDVGRRRVGERRTSEAIAARRPCPARLYTEPTKRTAGPPGAGVLRNARPRQRTASAAVAPCAHATRAEAAAERSSSWAAVASRRRRGRYLKRAAAAAAAAAAAPPRELVCGRTSCCATGRVPVFRRRRSGPAAVVSSWPCHHSACSRRCVQGPHVARLCSSRARVVAGYPPRSRGRGGQKRRRRDARAAEVAAAGGGQAAGGGGCAGGCASCGAAARAGS